jgi:hypothetical protein
VTLWLVLVVVLIVVIWGWRSGMRPAPNRIESLAEVSNALQFLIQRGINGGSVRFQVEMDASRAVLFTKYIIEHGNVGLRARCSRGREPESRFAALLDDLARRGIPHSITTAQEGEAIEMEIARDVGLGLMLVPLAFQDLFEVELRAHCVAFFEHVLIRYKASLTGVDDTPPS